MYAQHFLAILWFVPVALCSTLDYNSEVQALRDLFTATGGDNWNHKDSWSASPTASLPCDPEFGWYGVVCGGSATNNYIQNVILGDNNLVGTIPDSIGDLQNLQVLDLSRNSLSGPIPSSLYEILTLTQLQLYTNNFTGPIDQSIGALTNLQILMLSRNQLSGPIPNSLYGLTSLNMLDLSTNKLTGTIDPKIGNLNQLNFLFMAFNQLNGQIPSTISQITQLRQLQLTSNRLTGTIPVSFCNFVNLTGLWLETQILQGGGLTGPIPACLTNITTLQYLFLQNNHLSGGIPDSLFNFPNLLQLFLGANNLGGTISPRIKNLGKSVQRIDISLAKLTGSIPPEIGELTNLLFLGLGTNSLTGSIPSEIGNLEKIEQLLLQGTYNSPQVLSGTLPASLFNGLSSLNYLLLSDNHFTGPIPEVNLPALATLEITGCRLTGPIPDSLWNSPIVSVDLSGNNLQGSLPEAVATSSTIKSIDLRNNQISGTISSLFEGVSFCADKLCVKNNPFLCPIEAWTTKEMGASCQNWALSGISSHIGPTNIPQPMNITGNNFRNLSELQCSFGSSDSTPATYVSPNLIQCNTPTSSNISRTVPVSITYQYSKFVITGTTQTFLFYGVPSVTHLDPPSGREQGHSNVTISGTNFAPTDVFSMLKCKFGNITVNATYLNYTKIMCETPPHVPQNVTLSTSNDGKEFSSNRIVFNYFPYCDGLPFACSGNGICNTTIYNSPKCDCNAHFINTTCNQCESLHFGQSCLKCPVCGLNGTCDSGIQGSGLCICEPGFYGVNCSTCPPCKHGHCEDGQAGSGQCKCNFMWGNEHCDSAWKFYATVLCFMASGVLIFCIVGFCCCSRESEAKEIEPVVGPEEKLPLLSPQEAALIVQVNQQMNARNSLKLIQAPELKDS